MSLVFERVGFEENEIIATPTDASSSEQQQTNPSTDVREINLEDLKLATGTAPKGLKPCAADAFLLFQVMKC